MLLSLSVFGQRVQNHKNPSMLDHPTTTSRTEIVTPEVNGYKVIKADFHIHTIYSDGHVDPYYRVLEAWMDGLDALAVTDHIEYRPTESKMIEFLDGNVTKNEVEEGKIAANLNYSTENGIYYAKRFGLTAIHGAEITRSAGTVGHFNVLFTKDNNLIPDPDPLQALRNAHKQGALIQCNHPGWRKTDNEYTPVCEAAIREGLIDGVEIFNTAEFYPDVIDKAVKKGFFIAGGTDIHSVSHMDYASKGYFRNMTLVFAKDASEGSIREALESGRTLAYSYGDIAGSEQLLRDFFNACVSVKVLGVNRKGGKYVQITNRSSFPFVLNNSTLEGMGSILWIETGDKMDFKVSNMWFGTEDHPEFTVQL